MVQLICLAQSAGLSRIGFVADAPPSPARLKPSGAIGRGPRP